MELTDVELLVRYKAGQDELFALDCTDPPMPGAQLAPKAIAGNWAHVLGGAISSVSLLSDAVLLPVEAVDGINAAVRALGANKIAALGGIRDARKKLLYMAWEAAYVRGSAASEDAFYRDLALMRAVGEVRFFLSGANLASRARADIARADAQLAQAQRGHERALTTLERSAERLEAAIAQRTSEIARLSEQRERLGTGAAIQQALLSARSAPAPSKESGGKAAAHHTPHINGVLARARLRTAAQSQAAELKELEATIAALRKRSFVMLPAPRAAGTATTPSVAAMAPPSRLR